MNKLLLAAQAILFFIMQCAAYQGLYVAKKSGLNLREKPGPTAKVLEKNPYGTKVEFLKDNNPLQKAVTEGMVGYWQKVKYKDKIGYIVDSYLIPWVPPKIGAVKNLKDYLSQVSALHGKPITIKKEIKEEEIDDESWELHKQFYQNGAEIHEYSAYEYYSASYYLPDFNFQQGFLLCRLLEEFSDLFGEKDEFPNTSKKIRKGETEYNIEVTKSFDTVDYDGPYSIQKINIEFESGSFYQFQMYRTDGQLVIFYGYGL